MIANERFTKLYFGLKGTLRNQYRPSTYKEMADLLYGTEISEPEGFLTRDEIEKACKPKKKPRRKGGGK